MRRFYRYLRDEERLVNPGLALASALVFAVLILFCLAMAVYEALGYSSEALLR